MPLTRTTLRTAGSLTDDAIDTVRDLRENVKGLASRGLSAVSDGASVAQEQLGRYAGATGRYVSREPVKAALVAAAVGAAVAALMMMARSRRNRWY